MKITNNNGVLMTGPKECLGYLMDFKERGVWDATYGKVDVSVEDANKHNLLMDDMMIEGLDKTCQVGQGNFFYWDSQKGITTFTGRVVQPRTSISRAGDAIRFERGGKRFASRLRRDEDSIYVKRIA